VWCRKIERLGGQDVQQVCGGGERYSPIARRNTTLEQKGANSVIDSANNPFSFTVLRGSIWTGHAQANTIGQEEDARAGVVKLPAIVTLYTLYSNTKLCAHISKKVRQGGKSVRLEAQRKGPKIVGEIIKHHKIIFMTRNTSDWGRPKITMNQLKRARGARC